MIVGLSGSAIAPFAAAIAVLIAAAAPASAQGPGDEVKAFVAEWYQELRKRDDGRLWDVIARGRGGGSLALPATRPTATARLQEAPLHPHLLARRAQKLLRGSIDAP